MTNFSQLLLRFKVREHYRRTGQKPDRRTYARIHYEVTAERRRKLARKSKESRYWLRKLRSELTEAA